MRPVAFGEALSVGTRINLSSSDKPDRFVTVIKFGLMKPRVLRLHLEVAFLPIKSKTACRAVGPPPPGLRRDKLCRTREEGRTHLPIHLPIEEDRNNNRWCLWPPDLFIAGRFGLRLRSQTKKYATTYFSVRQRT